jgi:hypothetical protein
MLGTFVGGEGGGLRVVFDEPITHTRVNFTSVLFNGKQSWGCSKYALKYLGWRVNPEKL